jgi:hypothetical protein
MEIILVVAVCCYVACMYESREKRHTYKVDDEYW